jgi:ribosomal protein S6--L-glutamate ligase
MTPSAVNFSSSFMRERLLPIGIFTTNTGGSHDPHTQKIINQARAEGRNVAVFHPDDVTLGVGQEGLELWLNGVKHTKPPFSAVLPRLGARHVTPYALAVLKQLELMGTPSVNPVDSICVAEDKFATHQQLAKHGIPQPTTYMSWHPLQAEQLKALGDEQAYLKPNAFASGSKGMKRGCPESLNGEVNRDMVIQRGYPSSSEVDHKYVVIGGRVVYASDEVGRAPGAALESTVKQIQPDPAYARIAIEAVRAVGMNAASVDLIDSPHGPMVVDINPSQGFRGNEDKIVPGALLDYAETIGAKSVTRTHPQAFTAVA